MIFLLCFISVASTRSRLFDSALEDVDDALIVFYSPAILKWLGEYLLETVEQFAYSKRPVTMCNTDDARQMTLVSSFNKFGVLLVSDPWPSFPLHESRVVQLAHKTNRLYMLMSEQMTRSRVRDLFAKLVRMYPSTRIMHYSDANKKLATLLRPQAQQVVPFFPLLQNYERMWNRVKYFDVCTIGTASPRRSKIIKELLSRFGARFHEIRVFGEHRDIALSGCRVLVNLHANDDYTVLESIRCAPALVSGVLVVSENSLFGELTALEQHIVFAQSIDLVNGVNDTLTKYATLRGELLDFLKHRYTQTIHLTQPFLTLHDK